MSNVELYEALKQSVGEEAARLMANVIPAAENLATRQDLAEVRADLSIQISRLDTKIEASTKEIMRWLLVFFIPVWAGTWATLVAVLLKS